MRLRPEISLECGNQEVLLRKKVLLTILGLLLAYVIFWLTAGHFAMSSQCGEETISESLSPDGKLSAAVFRRNCGALHSYVMHVNLRAAGTPFAVGRDGAISEGQVLQVAGEVEITTQWDGAKKLLLKCKGCKANAPLSLVEQFGDVAISLASE